MPAAKPRGHVRIGVVTDIHCGPDMDTRLGTQASVQLDLFCEAMRVFRPDIIVDLGDRINDTDPGRDRERTVWTRSMLRRVGVPVLHLLGNHDVVNLPKAELVALLDKRGPSEYLDWGGLRLILLDSQDPMFDGVGGTVGMEQIAWLRRAVTDSPGPCMVFCHHPLDEQEVASHWFFGARPHLAHAVNRAGVRSVLEECGRVRAVLNGHMHWTRRTTISGIPYVTLGSLVDCALTDGRPAGTHAEVVVADTAVSVRVHGARPAAFDFPAR